MTTPAPSLCWRTWLLRASVLAWLLMMNGSPSRAQDAPPIPPPLPPAIVEETAPIPPPLPPLPSDSRPMPGTPDVPIRPPALRRPIDAEVPAAPSVAALPNFFRAPGRFFRTRREPPLGYTGPSGVMPIEDQSSDDFVPVEDRWRIGFPEWDRYGKGHPVTDDYPYMPGRKFDPFNQNVFKGDYPIWGQKTFLDISGLASLDFEGRAIPTPASGGFESTSRPGSFQFFGRNSSFITLDYFSVAFDLFHGDAGFKPVDWRIKIAPTMGVSNFSFSERAAVSPNVLQGVARTRTSWALQEAFVEAKIA